MSKVFITKNGQFVSRGEGVLTRIENPDLEVNDIGVEVSERIAEDVKEGDMLFNNVASYTLGQSYQHMYGVTSAKFVKNDEGLFCIIFGREYYPNIEVMKYVDGRWTMISDSNYGNDSLSPGIKLISNDSAALSLSSNRIVWAGINDDQSINYYFNSMGYIDGNIVKELSFDLSSVPLHYEYTSSNYSESKSVDLKEFDGDVYCVYSLQRNQTDTSGPTIFAYKINTSTNTITSIECESNLGNLAADSTLAVNLFEYNDELYCVTSYSLHKYDPLSNTFVYVSSKDGYTRRGNVLTTSSGDIYQFSTNYGLRINKFNPSTSSFDLVFSETTLSGIIYRPISCKGYETSDGICVAIFETPGAGDLYDGGVYRFDPDTSTVNSLGSIGPYKKSWYVSGVVNEYQPDGSDIIEYDGEYHLLKHQYYGEAITFYKSTNGRDFYRNTKWDTVPNGQFFMGSDIIEFSGNTFLYQGSRGTVNSISKYEPSGDYFDPHGKTDIHRLCNSARFLELSGDLYVVQSSEQSPYMFAYKYNVDADAFYKIADSATLAARSEGMYPFNFSGTQYISFHTLRNPPFQVATFDGSSFDILPDPSTIGSNYWNGHAAPLFESNGKLFAVSYTRQNQTSGHIGFNTYQLDGSSWIDVDPGPFENWITSGLHSERRLSLDPSYNFDSGSVINIVPFKIGSRQLILVMHSSYKPLRVYEYIDGSGWFLQDQEQPPSIRSSNYNQEQTIQALYDEGDIYFYIPSVGIVIRRNEGYWEHHVVDSYHNRSSDTCFKKLNGDINVFVTNFNRSLHRYKISPYIGERVWFKRKVYINYSSRIKELAYGIALQDGSKGDIIKIRRIKS
jgi:hypothetical protein